MVGILMGTGGKIDIMWLGIDIDNIDDMGLGSNIDSMHDNVFPSGQHKYRRRKED